MKTQTPKRLAMSLVTTIAVATFGFTGSATAQDDARTQELNSLRSTVEGMRQSLDKVLARIAELEGTNRAPSTNLVTAPAPSIGGSNYMVIAGQRIELPMAGSPFIEGDRSPIADYN